MVRSCRIRRATTLEKAKAKRAMPLASQGAVDSAQTIILSVGKIQVLPVARSTDGIHPLGRQIRSIILYNSRDPRRAFRIISAWTGNPVRRC